MDLNNAIEILEILAAGCSPQTGEILSEDSVLNQREVIRALQFAIDNLKKEATTSVAPNSNIIYIEEEDVKTVIQLLIEIGKPPTDDLLTDFFLGLGTSKFGEREVTSLYGKYKNQCTKGQLQDFFIAYLAKRGYLNKKQAKSKEDKRQPWDNIDFFEKPTFNNLSETEIDKLKEQINNLGLTKKDTSSFMVKNARKNYPRAYEPWHEEEIKIFDDTLNHTNDLEILSQCFKRGRGAIESFGKKRIFERNGN